MAARKNAPETSSVKSPSTRSQRYQAILTQGKGRLSPKLEQAANTVIKAYLSSTLAKMQEEWLG
jgi:hypothetical protein